MLYKASRPSRPFVLVANSPLSLERVASRALQCLVIEQHCCSAESVRPRMLYPEKDLPSALPSSPRPTIRSNPCTLTVLHTLQPVFCDQRTNPRNPVNKQVRMEERKQEISRLRPPNEVLKRRQQHVMKRCDVVAQESEPQMYVVAVEDCGNIMEVLLVQERS